MAFHRTGNASSFIIVNMKKKTLNILKNDPWLEPYAGAIVGRHNDAVNKEIELCGPDGKLDTFANAHNYFGIHRTADGWVFRDWRFFEMEGDEEICPQAKEKWRVGTEIQA